MTCIADFDDSAPFYGLHRTVLFLLFSKPSIYNGSLLIEVKPSAILTDKRYLILVKSSIFVQICILFTLLVLWGFEVEILTGLVLK